MSAASNRPESVAPAEPAASPITGPSMTDTATFSSRDVLASAKKLRTGRSRSLWQRIRGVLAVGSRPAS